MAALQLVLNTYWIIIPKLSLPFKTEHADCYERYLLVKISRHKLTLVLLQVDENGKIHRLRRECPADECGAGVFMASHFDRHYCGKCCLTYCFNKPEDK